MLYVTVLGCAHVNIAFQNQSSHHVETPEKDESIQLYHVNIIDSIVQTKLYSQTGGFLRINIDSKKLEKIFVIGISLYVTTIGEFIHTLQTRKSPVLLNKKLMDGVSHQFSI